MRAQLSTLSGAVIAMGGMGTRCIVAPAATLSCLMFTDRFQGSVVHGASRQRLSFESRVARANTIKDEWAFVWDDSIRYNIAYALQDVQFGVLLVNEYNVYWTPEAMI